MPDGRNTFTIDNFVVNIWVVGVYLTHYPLKVPR